jgi:hypothetical protein
VNYPPAARHLEQFAQIFAKKSRQLVNKQRDHCNQNGTTNKVAPFVSLIFIKSHPVQVLRAPNPTLEAALDRLRHAGGFAERAFRRRSCQKGGRRDYNQIGTTKSMTQLVKNTLI